MGKNEYIEKMKKEVESNLDKSVSWYEMPDLPKPEIMVKVFPFDELTSLVGQRIAAKMEFELFCQFKKQPLFLTDNHFNNIREFIKNGTNNVVHSHLFFDSKIMDQTLPCAFPWHSIFLVQRDKTLIAIVTLFGLFYLDFFENDAHSNQLGQLVLNNPQSKDEYEPPLRWNLFLAIIPRSAFEVGEEIYKKAVQYAHQKFRKASDE